MSPELTALIAEAKQTTCADWASRQGWKLRRTGAELIGPCPKCGGTDRFGINTVKDVWTCRVCGVGGDAIYLVCFLEDLQVVQACERIAGRSAAAPVDPERAAALERQREIDDARREAEAEQYRQKARSDAHAVWSKARGNEMAVVAAYLDRRRLGGGHWNLAATGWHDGMPLRFMPERAYWHDRRAVHTGPAMIAALQMPDGRFAGIHQTWIDLGRPKGKIEIDDPKKPGAMLPAKKVLGIKKTAAIRLLTPPDAHRMVMGEGIETTATAFAHAFEPGTAYWVGVDLGNMAGRAARRPGGGLVHDMPDMADVECFMPPDWVEELVYLCDGDEPEKHTVEKVKRGLRRARRRREAMRAAGVDVAPLSIKMVPPAAAGTDLNSIAMAEAVGEGALEEVSGAA